MGTVKKCKDANYKKEKDLSAEQFQDEPKQALS